jgi:HAMP domain-containing protein/HPt (histidine-containing phosphotransfer) domain-containing protein
MKPRFALTIYHKLIALIVALMVAVVGSLALYLSSQQIDMLTAELRTKAATYGSVMASQTTSAIAFSDRETAREVLQSIDADGDVASVALHDAAGAALYTRGTGTAGIIGATAAAVPRVIDTASRIVAINPVVIELSTDSLRAARSHVRRIALMTGLAALAAGVIAAWLIARQLALRLRAIANIASAVAGGDLTQQPIDDPRRDEIGTLATAFNAMLAQLKQLIAHIQELARKERDRLENLVAQRTAQLDQRTAEMQLVFDQVDQGLLMVDLDGTLATERSAAVERLLGPAPASGLLHDYVRGFAPDSAAWFALQWEALREDVLPPELCLAQLPSRFEIANRHLELAYKLTDTNGQLRVLVVISDVTAQVGRQRAERDERETSFLLSRMLRGRVGFLAFHAEAAQYVAAITDGPRDDAAFRRTVHTLKGISALEGIDSIAEQCHALETAMADGDELATQAAAHAIGDRWELVTHKIAPLIAAASTRLELVPGDLDRIETALRRGAPVDELLAIIDSWRHERIEPRLQRFADDAQLLAARLGKGPIEVTVEVDDDLRLPAERWAGFWNAFVHAIRNAIDHGIETPDERSAAGKPALAQLTLRAARRGDEIAIDIEDGGRGIDWARVTELACARGLPYASQADLVDALFHDGFTTRDTANEISGRGIGLSALQHACIATGGRATITSRDGAGTTLGFRWPRTPVRPEALQIAG